MKMFHVKHFGFAGVWALAIAPFRNKAQRSNKNESISALAFAGHRGNCPLYRGMEMGKLVERSQCEIKRRQVSNRASPFSYLGFGDFNYVFNVIVAFHFTALRLNSGAFHESYRLFNGV